MNALEALNKLSSLASYLESSIPDYMYEEWADYEEEQGGEMDTETNIDECTQVIRDALVAAGHKESDK